MIYGTHTGDPDLGPLTFEKMKKAIDEMEQRLKNIGGEKPGDNAVMHSDDVEDFLNAFNNDPVAQSILNSDEVPKCFEINGIRVLVRDYCPPGHVYFFNSSKFSLIKNVDF